MGAYQKLSIVRLGSVLSSSKMTLRNIYIVRHGYRSDWLPYPPPHPTGRECDPPLAPHGVDQAKELAAFLAGSATHHKPQVIFSSPFYRCVETAYPTSEALGVPIFLEQGIGEWYKPNRGPIPEPPRIEELHRFFPNVSNKWLWDTVVPSHSGEDTSDIFKRCQRFWEAFFPKFEKQFPNVDTVMLVSHAATKIALGMALLGYQNTGQFLLPEHGGDGVSTRIDASTCSLDLYYYIDKNMWAVGYVGNTDFLSEGGEMGWHFATSQHVAGSKEDIEARKKEKEIKKQQSNNPLNFSH